MASAQPFAAKHINATHISAKHNGAIMRRLEYCEKVCTINFFGLLGDIRNAIIPIRTGRESAMCQKATSTR